MCFPALVVPPRYNVAPLKNGLLLGVSVLTRDTYSSRGAYTKLRADTVSK